MLDLTPWHLGAGKPLSATDGEIAAATGATARQVAYARAKATPPYPSWGRGRPGPDSGADLLRPDQAEALEGVTAAEITDRLRAWVAGQDDGAELATRAVLREALAQLAGVSGRLRSWRLGPVVAEEGRHVRRLGGLSQRERARLATRAEALHVAPRDLAVEVVLAGEGVTTTRLRQQARAMARQVGVDLRDL